MPLLQLARPPPPLATTYDTVAPRTPTYLTVGACDAASRSACISSSAQRRRCESNAIRESRAASSEYVLPGMNGEVGGAK